MKKAAFTFIMAILVMPTQGTAMGFLRLITKMGMYDSLLPLIIPSIASPAVFYFMYSYLQSSLPLSLVEAARIDGSGEFRTFNSIVLPIMKPAVAVQAIFTFVGAWNNFLWPLVACTKEEMKTLPLALSLMKTQYNTDVGLTMACAVINFLPPFLFYIFMQSKFKEGLTMGGVKG